MVKNPPANAGDAGSILVLERSPAVGNGNPPQYSCLENSTDGRALQSVGSQNQVQLSTQALFSSGQSELMIQAFSLSHWKKSNSKSFQDWVFQGNHEDIRNLGPCSLSDQESSAFFHR